MEVLTVVFCIFTVLAVTAVVLYWIRSHYQAKNRMLDYNSPNEQHHVFKLHKKAVQLNERIKALETILDKDMPGWREKQ